MDIIDYLHDFGRELQGTNYDPEARLLVLRYVKERLQQALERIIAELEGEDGSDDSCATAG